MELFLLSRDIIKIVVILVAVRLSLYCTGLCYALQNKEQSIVGQTSECQKELGFRKFPS